MPNRRIDRRERDKLSSNADRNVDVVNTISIIINIVVVVVVFDSTRCHVTIHIVVVIIGVDCFPVTRHHARVTRVIVFVCVFVRLYCEA